LVNSDRLYCVLAFAVHVNANYKRAIADKLSFNALAENVYTGNRAALRPWTIA